MTGTNLSDYIKNKKEEYEKIRKEITFLEKIPHPLIIELFDNKLQLYSKDYSLATDVKINVRCKTLDSSSGYDGGIHKYRYDYYPQFYFTLKHKPKNIDVLIWHEGLYTEDNVIIQRVYETDANGIYSDKKSRSEYSLDEKKVICLFEKKGVKKGVINILENKIQEHYKSMHNKHR
jgi:hypothetical protein